MTVKIVVPELGESVLEATVGEWFKGEGDRVAVGDSLLELETDKVNIEVGAERAGVLAKILRQTGEDVQVGDVLGEIEEVEEPEAGVRPADQPPDEAAPPEAASAAAEQPAGVRPAVELPEEPASEAAESQAEMPAPAPAGDSRATPVAQRMARELNLDLARVPGTGPGGRVTRENIERYIEEQRAAPEPARQAAPRRKPEPAPGLAAVTDRNEERVKMSRRRRTIAQRLVEVQQTAAILTTFNEIDMSAVMDLRKRRNEAFQKRYGIKLGITSFFVKAAIGALKAFPRLNAEIQGDEMVLKRYYDIGIAVGASEGLVVPVLRNADRMSFAQIEQRIKEFVEQVEAGSLSLEDLRGGTFSITNGGVFGSLLSTPILNPPQVGILGLHKIEPRPVAVDGEIVIRPMMYVALSYDHRIVDGREAVQFLVRVKELVEDPETLLIEG